MQVRDSLGLWSETMKRRIDGVDEACAAASLNLGVLVSTQSTSMATRFSTKASQVSQSTHLLRASALPLVSSHSISHFSYASLNSKPTSTLSILKRPFTNCHSQLRWQAPSRSITAMTAHGKTREHGSHKTVLVPVADGSEEIEVSSWVCTTRGIRARHLEGWWQCHQPGPTYNGWPVQASALQHRLD